MHKSFNLGSLEGETWQEFFKSFKQATLRTPHSREFLIPKYAGYSVISGLNVNGLFNKAFVKDDREIELSFDYYPSVTKTILETISKKWKSPTKELNTMPDAEKEVPSFSIESCEKIIREVFSKEYADSLTGHPGKLESMIRSFSENRNTEYEGPYKRESPAMRLKEVKEDHTVIMMILPDDLSMKLNYRSNKADYPQNPLTKFYESHYWHEVFNKESRRHHFLFLEHLGHEMYPDNHKNVNTFDTLFDIYRNRAAGGGNLFVKGAKAQMDFVHEILPYLVIQCGTDNEGHFLLEKEDYASIKVKTTRTYNVKLYGMYRSFSCPYYDIIFHADRRWLEEEDVELAVATVHSIVFPCAENVPDKEGAHLHPLVYEAGK